MNRVAAAFVVMLAAAPVVAQDGLMTVPSGQTILPYEALWEDHMNEGASGETWLILRFLAPGISKHGGDISFEVAAGDLDFICAEIGQKLADMTGGGVDQIIVNLLDKPLARGQRDPEVTQFMNAYRIGEGVCLWE